MSSIVLEDVETFLEDTPSGTRQTSTSSSNPTESSNPLAVNHRRKRSSKVPERFRQDREKALAGRSNRELIRLLIQEEYDAKDTRSLLHAAFDRLELETQRVVEAEARVLEIAQRFRTVNDARVASQQETARANEELRLYKFQFDNAQQEIFRAQDILKTVEEQRDDAAAAATRARNDARKYRENHLVYMAREQGRRLGYEEGLRHARYGYAGVGVIGYDDDYSDSGTGIMNRLIAREPFNDTSPEDESADDVISPGSMNPPGVPSARATYSEATGRHASNLRPANPTPSLSPVNIDVGSSRPVSWPVPQPRDGYSPVIIHNTVPGPHPEPPIPPDGWIPRLDENQFISIPPAHEFERPPSSPTLTTATRTDVPSSHNQSRSVENHVGPSVAHIGHRRRVSSPLSTGSTTFSQFDLVSTGPGQEQTSLSNQLDIIPEVGTQGDLTPTASGRRSRIGTTLTNTPALETDYGYSPATDITLRSPAVPEYADTAKPNVFKPGDPRGRDLVQRFADELRYSDPDIVDSWRRSAVEGQRPADRPPPSRPIRLTRPAPLSPSAASTSSNLQNSAQSQSSRYSSIPIDVQPPSRPESFDAVHPHTPGLLSPYSLSKEPPPDDSNTSTEPKRIPSPDSRSSRSTKSRRQPPAYSSGSRTPRAVSPERDSRDKRRSKSTPREPPMPQIPYAVAPIPEGINYPPPHRQTPASLYASKIATSHSVGSTSVPRPKSSQITHDRSLSMHAGATPAHTGRPLSSLSREGRESTLRKTPSVSSSISDSVKSPPYKPYDPNEYLDPAFLASSDDLSAPVSSAGSSRSKNGSGRRSGLR